MTTKLIRTIAASAAVLLAGLALAACASDNATGPSEAQVKEAVGSSVQDAKKSKTRAATTTPATTTTQATTTAPATTTQAASADGKAIFSANCAGCHTLAAADASGQVGPSLDSLKPSASTVEAKVTGGGGGMPAFDGQLSSAEIKAVAEYVSSNAG